MREYRSYGDAARALKEAGYVWDNVTGIFRRGDQIANPVARDGPFGRYANLYGAAARRRYPGAVKRNVD